MGQVSQARPVRLTEKGCIKVSRWKLPPIFPALRENVFRGCEVEILEYAQWLVSLDSGSRETHYNLLDAIVDIIRFGHDLNRFDPSGPQCTCRYCAEWHPLALNHYDGALTAKKSRQPPTRNPKLCFVYLMRNGRNGLVKIGRSKTPALRESTLQSEEPEISMLFFFSGSDEIERSLHDRYALLRVRGEWFRLSESQVKFLRGELEDAGNVLYTSTSESSIPKLGIERKQYGSH